MKISINIMLFICSIMGFSTTAFAEIERPKNSILVPSKAPTIKGASATLSSANLKELQLDKTKLLRCWQYGQLIVAENGWQNPSAEGKTILTKGGERMIGYDYGETFCLYMSN